MVINQLDLLIEESLINEKHVLVTCLVEVELKTVPIVKHILLFVLNLELFGCLVGYRHQDLQVLLILV